MNMRAVAPASRSSSKKSDIAPGANSCRSSSMNESKWDLRSAGSQIIDHDRDINFKATSVHLLSIGRALDYSPVEESPISFSLTLLSYPPASPLSLSLYLVLPLSYPLPSKMSFGHLADAVSTLSSSTRSIERAISYLL